MKFLEKVLKGKRRDDAQSSSANAESPFGVPETNPQEVSGLDAVVVREVPEARFAVAKGVAEQPAYSMKRERVLVGRTADVLDKEGRIVRRNDIVFLENASDINVSVEPAHARIWYDRESRGYCILDEGSHYGTHIVRNGLALEVPGVDSHGIQLQSGDNIYFGQACLHFELGNESA